MTKRQTKQIKDRLDRILKKLDDQDDDETFISSSDQESDSEIHINKHDLSEISEISSIESINIDSILEPQPKRVPEAKISNSKISKIPVRSKIEEKNLPRPSIREQKPLHPVVAYSQSAKQYATKPERPVNFFAVDYSQFEHAIVCIYKGIDFPRPRQGERSTYVLMRLHDQIQELVTPISFDSHEAIYNAGFKLDTLGLDFENFTPVIEVYDFHGENDKELIGVGYIQLQIAKKQDRICTVLHDSWVNIYTLKSHIKCGKVLMTFIFYDNEDDIKGMIKNPTESQEKVEKTVEQPIKQPVQERPVKKESMAVQAEVVDIPSETDDNLFASDDFEIPIRQEKAWKSRVWQGQERKAEAVGKENALDESFSSEVSTKSFHKRKPAKPNIQSKIRFVTEINDSDDEVENKTDRQQNSESSMISNSSSFFTKRKSKAQKVNEQPKSQYASYADYGLWS